MLTALRLHPLPKQRSAGSLLAQRTGRTRGVLRLRRIGARGRGPPRSACAEPRQDAAAARLLGGRRGRSARGQPRTALRSSKPAAPGVRSVLLHTEKPLITFALGRELS